MADPGVLVDALEHTWASVIAVCEPLDTREWALPTACPGWSVKDIVAHLAGIERTLQGHPQPEHEVPDYPWIRNDVGRLMEIAIDVRRPWPPDQVLTEFREVTRERLEALRSTKLDPMAEVTGPLGTPTPLARMLTIRVIDSWTHEQDIREALGVAGGLASPAAAVTRDLFVKAVPRVARNAGMAPGERVAIEVAAPDGYSRPTDSPHSADGRHSPDGPAPVSVTVIAAENPAERARVVEGIEPAATRVQLGFREFTRRAGGRLSVAEALAGGVVDGDRELAERFLAGLVVTP